MTQFVAPGPVAAPGLGQLTGNTVCANAVENAANTSAESAAAIQNNLDCLITASFSEKVK
jgi:hypothetical protein